MTDCLSTAAFLLTYLIHSTVLLSGVWIVTRLWRSAVVEYRDVLWKFALLGGIVTSVIHWSGLAPHWGPNIALSSRHNESATADETAIDATYPSGKQRRTGFHPERDGPDIRVAVSPSVGRSETVAEREAGLAILIVIAFAWLWSLVVVVLLGKLAWQWIEISLHSRRCRRVTDRGLTALVSHVARQVGARSPVEVYVTPGNHGPMIVGLFRYRLFVASSFLCGLDREQLEALLGHELAHVAHADTWWNLLTQTVCSTFFFQPMNFYAQRQIRVQAEYLADSKTASVSGPLGLARCLEAMSEWSRASKPSTPPGHAVAFGMRTYRSLLGQRVNRLLCEDDAPLAVSRKIRAACIVSMLMVVTLVYIAAPRASAARGSNSRSNALSNERNKPTKELLAVPLVASGATDARPPKSAAVARAEKPLAPHSPPKELKGFSGMVIGTLVSKDIEKGEFVLTILHIHRVWGNNQCDNPRICVGKTLRFGDFRGEALDKLLLVKKGEMVEVEAQYHGGERLSSLDNIVNKLEPSILKRQFETGEFPDSLRQFSGILVGKLAAVDAEEGALTLKVDCITRVWRDNRTEEPFSAEGRILTIVGITGEFQEKLAKLKIGDQVEVEAQHKDGTHLNFTGEWLRKVEVQSNDQSHK